MKTAIYILTTILTLYALYTDIKRREIDDFVSITGAIAAIIYTALGHNAISIKESIIGGIFAFVLFYIIPVGGGDMKFFTFIGFLTGVKGVIVITFLSCVFTVLLSPGYIIKNALTIKKQHNEQCSKIQMIRKIFHVEVPFMIGIAPAVLYVLWFNNPYIQHFYSVFDLFVKNITMP